MTPLSALRALRDNLVWTLVGPGGRAVVVDPGEAAPVLAAIDAGLTVSDILITHHHPDHTGGIAAVVARSGARVHGPPDPRIEAPCRAVADGERFQAAGLEVAVIAVPGHTRSHVAYLAAGHLFCGDTLFSLGCGRMFEGSAEQMVASLDRLAALPGDTRVCCGHEYTLANAAFARAVEPENPAREAWVEEAGRRLAARGCSLPSTVAIERAANPFLRTGVKAIGDALRARGLPTGTRAECFAGLRAWKDHFA